MNLTLIELYDERPLENVLACEMLALAERAWRQQEFIDVAYSTPLYLKEFQATKPRNPILNL